MTNRLYAPVYPSTSALRKNHATEEPTPNVDVLIEKGDIGGAIITLSTMHPAFSTYLNCVAGLYERGELEQVATRLGKVREKIISADGAKISDKDASLVNRLDNMTTHLVAREEF